MEKVLIISLGASMGALSRWGACLLALRWFSDQSLATFFVNTTGSFVIGLFLPLAAKATVEFRLFLMIGFLGAYTTMSSFAAEVVASIFERRYWQAAVHWSCGSLFPLLACICGVWLSSQMVTR